jgi:hypothetical protein
VAFDESLIPKKDTSDARAVEAAKKLMIDAYRKPFLDAIPRCPTCGERMVWRAVRGEKVYACNREDCARCDLAPMPPIPPPLDDLPGDEAGEHRTGDGPVA